MRKTIVVSYQVEGFVNQRLVLTDEYSHLTNDEISRGIANGDMTVTKTGALVLKSKIGTSIIIGTNGGVDDNTTCTDFTVQDG